MTAVVAIAMKQCRRCGTVDSLTHSESAKSDNDANP